MLLSSPRTRTRSPARLPPGFQGLGKVSERPVAPQRRALLTAAHAAVAVLLSGDAGTHVQSDRRNRRRSECGDFKCAEWISALEGICPRADFAATLCQPACCRDDRKTAFTRWGSSLAGRRLGKTCRLYARLNGTVVVRFVPCVLGYVFDVPVSPLGPTFCASVAIWWPHVDRE